MGGFGLSSTGGGEDSSLAKQCHMGGRTAGLEDWRAKRTCMCVFVRVCGGRDLS